MGSCSSTSSQSAHPDDGERGDLVLDVRPHTLEHAAPLVLDPKRVKLYVKITPQAIPRLIERYLTGRESNTVVQPVKGRGGQSVARGASVKKTPPQDAPDTVTIDLFCTDVPPALEEKVADALDLLQATKSPGYRAQLERAGSGIVEIVCADGRLSEWAASSTGIGTVRAIFSGLIQGAVEQLPFGQILVRLGKGIVDRCQLMRENYAAAGKLGRKTQLLVAGCEETYRFFVSVRSEAGIGAMLELIECTIEASQLVAEVLAVSNAGDPNKKKALKKVAKLSLEFFGCRGTEASLMSAKEEVEETWAAVNIIFVAAASKALQTGGERASEPTSPAETNIPLAFESVPDPVGATKFWAELTAAQGHADVDVWRLIGALENCALDADVDLDQTPEAKDKLEAFFANRKDNPLKTDASRFAVFLKKHKAPSVGAAVAVFVAKLSDGAALPATTAEPSPVLTATNLASTLPAVSFSGDLRKHQGLFVEGTREWVFADLEVWARAPDSTHRRVYWIMGTGGLGKSVIAGQLVKRYGSALQAEVDGNSASGTVASRSPPALHLGAYFFCKHNDEERSDVRRAIITLAYRLAVELPALQQVLGEIQQDGAKKAEFEAHATGGKGTVEDVFKVVLADPLTKAMGNGKGDDVFVLIDALDELTVGAERKQFLQLIGRQLPTLPQRVRFIVTSRPEDDIVKALSSLKPKELGREEDTRQVADLRIYLEKTLLGHASLGAFSKPEREEVLALALEAAAGVFLAARLVQEGVLGMASKEPPTVEKIKSLLHGRSGMQLVNGTYLETLERIQTRICQAAKERNADDPEAAAEMEAMLMGRLRQVLQVLVAAREPIFAGDLQALSGLRTRGLTGLLLEGLSLLFAAEDGGAGQLQPLHKTVIDFLSDRELAGETFFADERLGHARLAVTSLAALVEKGVLDAERATALSEEEVREMGGTLVAYALRHGHMHLAECASLLGSEEEMVDEEIGNALLVWQDMFLVERSTQQGVAMPDGYFACPAAAAGALAAWLVVQSVGGGAKRRQVFAGEFLELQRALVQKRSLVEKIGLVPLVEMVDVNARLFGAEWAPHIAAGGEDGSPAMTKSVAMFMHKQPIKEALMRSEAEAVLAGQASADPSVTALVKTMPAVVGVSANVMTMAGHGGRVYALTLSSDGQTLYSGSEDKTIKVWDLAAGTCKSTLQGHGSSVQALTLSPDGQTLYSGSSDRTIKVWDLAAGTCTTNLRSHGAVVNALTPCPDGQALYSGSNDETIKVWDLATGTCTATLHGHGGSVIALALSPDGQTLYGGNRYCTIEVWTLATGTCTATLQNHCRSVIALALSPDGQTLYSGSDDETVKVWDLAAGTCTTTLQGHGDSVYTLTLSPDGQTLYSGSEDETIKVWDLATGACRATLQGHGGCISALALSSDGQTLLSGSKDQTIKVWYFGAGACPATLQGHDGSVHALAVSPDGHTLYSGSTVPVITVWDLVAGTCTTTLQGHDDSVHALMLSQDGQTLFSGSRDETIKVWDLVASTCTTTLRGHDGSIYTLTLSVDGQTLYSGSEDDTIKVWDFAAGICRATLQGHDDPVNVLALSIHGQELFSGSGDETIKVWDLASGICRATLYGHDDSINVLALGLDGQTLCSGSDDQTIKVWDLVSGTCTATLHGPGCAVNVMAFSHDRQTLYSSSCSDATIKVWDLVAGICTTTLHGHGSMVNALAVSPDGKMLYSGSSDRSVKAWDLKIVATCTQPTQ